MARFYVTYGGDPDQQDYVGGWTVVEAEDMESAERLYMAFHAPRVVDGVLYMRCCTIYTEDDFIATAMSVHGNLGAYCHELIYGQRIVVNKLK